MKMRGFKSLTGKLLAIYLTLVAVSVFFLFSILEFRTFLADRDKLLEDLQSVQGGRILELRPPLTRFDLFHYLHEKHASLVPILAAELSKMRREGRLAAIREHVMTVLIELARNRRPICAEDYRCFEEGLPAR